MSNVCLTTAPRRGLLLLVNCVRPVYSCSINRVRRHRSRAGVATSLSGVGATDPLCNDFWLVGCTHPTKLGWSPRGIKQRARSHFPNVEFYLCWKCFAGVMIGSFSGSLARGLTVGWRWRGGGCSYCSGVLPAFFAIVAGTLVGAVQRGESVVSPLILVGIVFVPLQVLPVIHRAIGANLGSRTSAWLYDRLATACVRPPGMGHLESPKLTSDLTMARDFDQGITGPPMSISMDFIAGGLVEMVAGLARRGGAGRLCVVGSGDSRGSVVGDALAVARERRVARS